MVTEKIDNGYVPKNIEQELCSWKDRETMILIEGDFLANNFYIIKKPSMRSKRRENNWLGELCNGSGKFFSFIIMYVRIMKFKILYVFIQLKLEIAYNWSQVTGFYDSRFFFLNYRNPNFEIMDFIFFSVYSEIVCLNC